ncbi:PLP-dependent aminotransferase family protein, partial [Micromonospora aurantiaca]|nr:PLP-dependent aminotransferase family protein [Micromonospora aurantiaca]
GTERAAVEAAAGRSIALDGLAGFRHPDAVMPAPDGLVVGYATPPEHAYAAALEALCRILPRSPLPHRSGGPALEDRGPTR